MKSLKKDVGYVLVFLGMVLVLAGAGASDREMTNNVSPSVFTGFASGVLGLICASAGIVILKDQ